MNKLKRMHWAVEKKHMNEIMWAVKEAVSEYGTPDFDSLPPGHKMQVRIHRDGKRMLDRDNLIGGAKPIVDALVRCGYAADDTTDDIEVEYSQASGSKDPCTLVTVRWPEATKTTPVKQETTTPEISYQGGTMFNFSDWPVEIGKVRLDKGVIDNDGVSRVRARIELSAEVKDLAGAFGYAQCVIEALVEEGRRASEDDGPNSYTLKVKRTFDSGVYRMRVDGVADIEVNVDIALQPVVKVVEGDAHAVWKVDTKLDGDEVALLVSLLASEDSTVLLTTRNAQNELDFGAEAAA